MNDKILFGINKLSPSELEKNGYKKIPKDYYSELNALFTDVPRLISEKMMMDSAKKAFDEAVSNSFICFVDPGTHLSSAKDYPGFFRGGELSDVNNQVAGQALFRENDATFNIIMPKQIEIVFSIVMAIGRQYYLSNIDSKLTDIAKKLDSIKNYLQAIEDSKIETAIYELDDVAKHFAVSKDRMLWKNKLDSIITTILRSICLYKKT